MFENQTKSLIFNSIFEFHIRIPTNAILPVLVPKFIFLKNCTNLIFVRQNSSELFWWGFRHSVVECGAMPVIYSIDTAYKNPLLIACQLLYYSFIVVCSLSLLFFSDRKFKKFENSLHNGMKCVFSK